MVKINRKSRNLAQACRSRPCCALPQFPCRFVQNIKAGYITKQVLDAHGISNEMLSQLRDDQTSEDAFKEILSLVEKNIGWQQLLQRVPKNHTVAVKICTNLVGLTDKKIDALIEHSE